MTIPLDKIVTMPAFSPYYPMPPARYRGVRWQNVLFRAERSAVDRVLPDCFEPSDDGFCVASGLTVPWSASYGAFQESFLSVRCGYQGQVGYFSPVAFLNSRSSIPAGREIYGTPKVFADIEVSMDERVMYTQTRIAGVSVLSVRLDHAPGGIPGRDTGSPAFMEAQGHPPSRRPGCRRDADRGRLEGRAGHVGAGLPCRETASWSLPRPPSTTCRTSRRSSTWAPITSRWTTRRATARSSTIS